ncbi:hypothetical protein HQ560_10230, partial [bacterium]|nr:hypothetical protein [bacterium]
MAIGTLNGNAAVPKPIVDMLTRLIRRTRHLIVLRGLCAVAAAAVGSMLLVMGIDATVTLFSQWTRWALSLSAYGVTAAAAAWFLVRPLAHSFTLTGIARTIETRHPELQERISSAVELLTSTDAPELRGSEQLIAALVEQATTNVSTLQPRREVAWTSARPFLITAGITLAVLAGLFILWPAEAFFLLKRATAPFINLPNLLARDIEVSPGDVTILEGQRLEVEVLVENSAVRSARLRMSVGEADEESEAMAVLNRASVGGRRFALTCAPAEASFRYRVHAGDALSQYYGVTVVPRPAVDSIDLRYDYPKYAKLPFLVEADSEGHIAALPGTRVTVTLHTNKPMAEAVFLINTEPIEAEAVLAEDGEGAPSCTFSFVLAPEMAGRWAVRLVDRHGFESSSAEYTIEAVADTAPIASILTPEETQLRLPPTARVPVSFAIEDDTGIADARLLIEVDGRPRPAKVIKLPNKGRTALLAHTGEASIDFVTLNLRNAKYVTFQLRATDTLPRNLNGPQHALTDLYRIQLDVRAPTFAAAKLMDEERKLRDTLEKIKKDLRKAKNDSKQLKKDLPRRDEPEERDEQRIDELRKNLEAAEDTAERLAREMEGGHFQGLAEKVQELADDHIAKAESQAGEIKLTDDARERGQLATTADRLVDRSLAKLEELMEEIAPAADLVRKAVEMDELAKREAELAAEKHDMADAAQAAEGDPAEAADAAMAPEDWQKAQENVAKELAEMLRDVPGDPQAVAKADEALAGELAQQAQEMAAEQGEMAEGGDALDRLQEIDQELADIAAQQQQLADQAAADPAAQAQAQAEPMAGAAENIQEGDLADAIQQQTAAEAGLEQAAEQLAQAGGEQAGE